MVPLVKGRTITAREADGVCIVARDGWRVHRDPRARTAHLRPSWRVMPRDMRRSLGVLLWYLCVCVCVCVMPR